MNCIAIDDEPLALKIIEKYCEMIPSIELLKTFSNAIEASQYLKDNEIDLMFVDINMPHISGIEFVKILSNPPMIIFTTAYQNYALTGFELSAIDYLVKPFSFDRFFKAVSKADGLLTLKKQAKGNSEEEDYIMIKVEYSTVKVYISHILYVEGLKDYIKIVSSSKNYVTKSTMKNIEEKLTPYGFMRIHKSFIINLKMVDSFENNHVVISNHKIPLGSGYKDPFFQYLEKNKL